MSGGLSNATYIRSENGAPTRDSTIPRFHYESVPDPAASAAAGRPIYRDEERVQIIQPGNPNQPVFRVDDSHRGRWPQQYEAFKKGNETPTDGTPLEHWPILTRSRVLEMKAIGLFTIEQCAGLTDLAIQRLGMDGRRMKDLANAFLDDAESSKITTAAVDRAERAEALLANLQKQADENKDLLNRMHAELMAMKNAPEPIEVHRPSDHDPIQQSMQSMPVAPPQYPVGSSIPMPRKRLTATALTAVDA